MVGIREGGTATKLLIKRVLQGRTSEDQERKGSEKPLHKTGRKKLSYQGITKRSPGSINIPKSRYLGRRLAVAMSKRYVNNSSYISRCAATLVRGATKFSHLPKVRSLSSLLPVLTGE